MKETIRLYNSIIEERFEHLDDGIYSDLCYEITLNTLHGNEETLNTESKLRQFSKRKPMEFRKILQFILDSGFITKHTMVSKPNFRTPKSKQRKPKVFYTMSRKLYNIQKEAI